MKELDLTGELFGHDATGAGAVIGEQKDCMFGHRRDDQSGDSRFQAAAIEAGFRQVMELRDWTVEAYRQRARCWMPPVSVFEAFLASLTVLDNDTPHWGPLFSLGTHMKADWSEQGFPPMHFTWWDGQTLRMLIDHRKSRNGDFSRTVALIAD